MSGFLRLGVDFGTSHTVAVLRRRDGGTTPLLFDGSPLLPSAVYAQGPGDLYTGRDATHSARVDPARFEPHPKRRVDDGTLLLGDAEPTVSQVFAAVLRRVRDECVRVAGDVPPATLTHPATWGPARRLILQDAAAEAGFTDVDLLAEPVAAATYFTASRDHDVPMGAGVVVFDFGGGTVDVSVLVRTADGFEVRAVDGSPELGGVDLDHVIVGHLGRHHHGDPQWTRLVAPETADERRHNRAFRDDVRAAKERLSRLNQVDLLIPMVDREIHLTRAELEETARPLLDKAVRLTTAVIRASALPDGGVVRVYLVGGASRMPLVATLLHRATGIAPTVIDQPELVVAEGATLDADGAAEVAAAGAEATPVGVGTEPTAPSAGASPPVASPVTPQTDPARTFVVPAATWKGVVGFCLALLGAAMLLSGVVSLIAGNNEYKEALGMPLYGGGWGGFLFDILFTGLPGLLAGFVVTSFGVSLARERHPVEITTDGTKISATSRGKEKSVEWAKVHNLEIKGGTLTAHVGDEPRATTALALANVRRVTPSREALTQAIAHFTDGRLMASR